ncbi:MAG: peptidyl-prolyl cis-trans isomerase [Acidobacteriota bacterium]|nr:peptidyl-prolyl cis-trans isomerase [Acidobacteriota bacterium]
MSARPGISRHARLLGTALALGLPAAALALGLPAAAAAEPAGPATEPVCAILAARIARLPAAVRQRPDAGSPDPGSPGSESTAAWRRRVIAAVEVEAALAAEARALGLDGAPDWRERFSRRRGALLLAALESSFAAGVEVEPEAVEARYAANRESFRSPEKIGTSFILLALPPDAAPEAVEAARRRLLAIRAEHAAGERFGVLARRHSAAENAPRGGAVAASPRGGLLAAYEDAAWALRPGEVSAPFRLPDGLAIVRLDNVFPARELGLEAARPAIEKRLLREETQARREAALAEARALWPAAVDWPPGASGPVEIRLAGEVLALEDLGLAHRPPRLRERVAAELDRRRLERLAEHRGLAEHTPTAAALAALRESMLAAAALERRVELLVPAPGEQELQALYGADPRRFPSPERRVFEVFFLPGEEGALRAVREAAQRQAAAWRAGTPPAELETWGPITRAQIGGTTSPNLAAVAFELAAGEVSEPVRLERYRRETARFEAEGYVVLRPREIEPASTLPFEAVRDRLASAARREERERAASEVRAELAAGLDLDLALSRFETCPLEEPPSRRPSRPEQLP